MFSTVREIISYLNSCKIAIARGSVIGFLVGALPGTGHVTATFFAYLCEKKISKYPEKFGTGVMNGVAAPEAANSASNGGALIPMLSLGIPGSKSTAMMLVALMMAGIKVGPLIVVTAPTLVWGLISSLYLANIFTLLIVMPFAILVFARLMTITPYRVLYPLILVICVMGAYSFKFDVQEVWQAIFFGIIGYGMLKADIPIVSLSIALILGPMFEEYFVESMILSNSSPLIFFSRPLSLVMVVIIALIIVSQFYSPSALIKIGLQKLGLKVRNDEPPAA